MDNKKIARYAHAFIGGIPKVVAYNNGDKSKTIDIMTCTDENALKDTSLSTIGLSSVDIGRTLDSMPLRIELLIAGRAEKEEYANILASSAFVIQEGKECDFGMIINDVVTPYVKDTDLAHVVLLHPVFWRDYTPLEMDDAIVSGEQLGKVEPADQRVDQRDKEEADGGDQPGLEHDAQRIESAVHSEQRDQTQLQYDRDQRVQHKEDEHQRAQKVRVPPEIFFVDILFVGFSVEKGIHSNLLTHIRCF